MSDLDMLDVRLLRAFATACETLSFTKAAARLGLTQPRFSLLIRKLEEQVGVPLFLRQNRRVALTPAGESLAEKVRPLLASMDEVEQFARNLRSGAAKFMRIGSPRYTFHVPARNAALERFAELRPDVRIEVCAELTPALLQMIHAGELDIAFATSPFDEADLEVLPFAASIPYLAIPEEHPLAMVNEIRLERLAGEQMAIYPHTVADQYLRAWFGPFLAAGVVPVPVIDDHPRALLGAAGQRRILTVYHHWEGLPAPRLPRDIRVVLRRISADIDLRMHLSVVRARRTTPSIHDRFWDLARVMASEPSAEPPDAL